MAERLKATDCKSVLSRVRRFEPCSAHSSLNSKLGFQIWNKFISGSSSFGRAVAFQASGGRFEPGLPLQKVNGHLVIGQLVSLLPIDLGYWLIDPLAQWLENKLL